MSLNNRLLRALPSAVLDRLSPALVTVPLTVGQYLYRAGDPLEHVYFPNDGVVSITTPMADGSYVEAATVGIEGMVGLEVMLGPHAIAPGDIMVQVDGGSAERVCASALRRELAHEAVLHVLGRYSQAVIAQMMQSAACNALHPLSQRCARWLLMTQDRVGRDQFGLSHEFLAGMLAVRRSSVTVVAGSLQAAGLIDYRHGHLRITDRAGLERASCECYAAIRARFDALGVDGGVAAPPHAAR